MRAIKLYKEKVKAGQKADLVLKYKRINRSEMSAAEAALPMTLFSIA